MTAPSADERPTEEQRKARSVWDLREDEKRVLFVTTVGGFIGGLAANIGLVLVVGLGLLIAHYIPARKFFEFDIHEPFLYIPAMAAGAALSGAGVAAFVGKPGLVRALIAIFVAISVLDAVAITAAIVGYAAGIK